MATSINIPALNHAIRADIPAINEVIKALAKNDPSVLSDLESGTKRIVEGSAGWEIQQYNGTSWVTLSDFNINAQKVDGFSASQSVVANAVAVRDAQGKLPGDITGNAATASKAAALSATNPVSLGGTGGTTPEKARENLGVPPTGHASGGTTYGIGTRDLYGHTKTHDEPDAALTAAGGHALSPAGGESLRALIAEEVAKCLKLSGGTMTGMLKVPSLFTVTRSKDDPEGSEIRLEGKNDATRIIGIDNNDGRFRIIQYASPDGSKDGPYVFDIDIANNLMFFGDKAVLTSAGGRLNVGACISVGTHDGIYDSKESGNTGIGINANSPSGRGATLALRDIDAGGSFALGARDASVANYLSGFTDGRLTWAGKRILTEAGGVITGNTYFHKTLVWASGSNEAFFHDQNSRTQMWVNANGGFHIRPKETPANDFMIDADGTPYSRGQRILTSADVVVGSVGGNSFTLPAGGTWAYTYHRSTYGDNAGGSGYAAGGTTITSKEGPTSYLAIRVA